MSNRTSLDHKPYYTCCIGGISLILPQLPREIHCRYIGTNKVLKGTFTVVYNECLEECFLSLSLLSLLLLWIITRVFRLLLNYLIIIVGTYILLRGIRGFFTFAVIASIVLNSPRGYLYTAELIYRITNIILCVYRVVCYNHDNIVYYAYVYYNICTYLYMWFYSSRVGI